jgi:hypothetical protein
MIIRNLDANSDWTFGKGTENYLQGDAAIALNIRTRIYSWLNDCFFAMSAGIDWFNRLGGKNQRTLLEADLRRIILQSDGVTGIISLYTVLNGRAFTASYNITTINSKSYQGSLSMGK